MLKDHIDVIIGVFQEEESEGRMDHTFAVASWNNPYLRRVFVVIQKRECRGCKLEVVDLQIGLSKHTFNLCCFFFDQFLLFFKVVVPLNNRRECIHDVVFVIIHNLLFVFLGFINPLVES